MSPSSSMVIGKTVHNIPNLNSKVLESGHGPINVLDLYGITIVFRFYLVSSVGLKPKHLN